VADTEPSGSESFSAGELGFGLTKVSKVNIDQYKQGAIKAYG
jgi:hypothetical protein